MIVAQCPLAVLERLPAHVNNKAETAPDLVLFLHGLGCSKENFSLPFTNSDFYPDLHLLAPDLPGHGNCRDHPPDQASMENMATSVIDLLAERDYEGLHIIGHSMGCAVGLLAVGLHDLNPRSFISVEGNLSHLDCGLLSRRAAETAEDIFVAEKFAKIKIQAAQSADPQLRSFALCLQACQPRAFHHAARSLVAWSDKGDLLNFFQQCSASKIYLYGERSGDPKTVALLQQYHIRTQELPGCGHFAPSENPTSFHHQCADLILEAQQKQI